MASVEDVSQDPGEERTTNPPQSTPEMIEEIPIPEAEGTAAVVEEDHATGGIGPVSEEEQGSAAADQSQGVEPQDNIVADPVTESSPGTSSPPQKKPRIGRAPEAHAYYEEDNHPDLAGVRYVEVQNYDATGWGGMAKTVKEYDEEKILFCKEDIDTLLVFAGLYSAILSAFIIESYQRLQPNSGDQMVQLFQAFFAQNYTISSGFLNSTNPYPTLPPFEAPTWAVRVNVLWFSSLIISLASASFGMLVKQWLREYLRMPYTSPQERLRARQFRRKALDDWRVFDIAAALPLMLEISVLLFFVGLCYFTLAIHWSIGRTTIPLVGGWAFFFIAATVAPVFSPRCPYKTTLLDSVMMRARKLAYAGAKLSLHVYYATPPSIYSAARRVAGTVRRGSKDLLLAAFQHIQTFTAWACGPLIPSVLALVKTTRKWTEIPPRRLKRLQSHMHEEADVLQPGLEDIELLESIIDLVPGDGMLATLTDMFKRQNPTLRQVNDFVLQIMEYRVGELDTTAMIHNLTRLGLLSRLAWDASVTLLAAIFNDHLSKRQAHDDDSLRITSQLFVSLTLVHDRPLPTLAQRVYDRIVDAPSRPLITKKPEGLFIADYKSLSSYFEAALISTDGILTTDGELEGWTKKAFQVLLMPWNSSHRQGPRPPWNSLSPELCRTVLEQLAKAIAKNTSILRSSDALFKHTLFSTILASTAEIPRLWGPKDLGVGRYPPLSLAFYTQNDDENPAYSHGTSLDFIRSLHSAGVLSSLSPKASIHPEYEGSYFGMSHIANIVSHLRPGMRGILIDVLLYQFISETTEWKAAFLGATLHICRSASQQSCPPTPPIDFCSLLSMIIRLKDIIAQTNLPMDTPGFPQLSSAARQAVRHRYSAYLKDLWKNVARDENIVVAMAVVKFMRARTTRWNPLAKKVRAVVAITASSRGRVPEDIYASGEGCV